MANKILKWAPRVLSLLFVAFLSIFALDVFGQYHGWELLLALLMHLIPSLFLLAVALLAWKFELVGTIVFIGFGIFYIFAAPREVFLAYLSISGPTLLIGILFLLNWFLKKRLKHGV